MKTIKITKDVREMIRLFSEEDETVDDTLNRLFDLFEPSDQIYGKDCGITNVSIDEATLDRLKSYKMTIKESHSDTILRLLLQLE